MKNIPQKLILKQGAIYNDSGQKIPLEIGNDEQIELIKNYHERMEQFKEGLEIDIEFETIVTASINFKCLCGNYKSMEQTTDSEDNDCFDNAKISCQCGLKYKVFSGDVYDEAIIKLID